MVQQIIQAGVGTVKSGVSLATDGLVVKSLIMVAPSHNMANGFTTVPELGKPDYDLALEQHQEYVKALRNAGVSVDVYPSTNKPDQHFVEDMASVFRSSSGELVAVVARPATTQRGLEVNYVVDILSNHIPKSNILRLPATVDLTLEFGDVVRFGGNVIVGQSKRTNKNGMLALKEALASINPGYTVHPLPVTGGLHADTCMSPINTTKLLHDPAMLLRNDFPFEAITLPNSENYAASVLPINDRAIIMPIDINHMSDGYPFTHGVLSGHFKNVVQVQMSEFHKADGSLRCLKLVTQWDGLE